MSTLYLAWQHPPSRRWFPVGRLVRRQCGAEEFEFAYVQGAKEAETMAGFRAIPEFPSFDQRYRASALFPTFRNRAMNASREDRAEYLLQLGLDAQGADEFKELSVSGGRSYSDSYEVFPEIEPDPDGKFHVMLAVHGLRHSNAKAVQAVQELRVGEELGVALELNNPVTGYALRVHTLDYHTLGWLPRYIAEGIHESADWETLDAKVTVARVNPCAPLSQRLMVNFSGRLPAGVNPMRDSAQFQPIGKSGVKIADPAAD